MNHDEIEVIFQKTLDDRRLSRGERQALGEIFDELDPSPRDRAAYLARAFAAAEATLTRQVDREVLDWLLAVTKTVALPPGARSPLGTEVSEACFGPDENCAMRLQSLISESAVCLDICVFTITDTTLAEAILAAHQRGLKVRIITDDETSLARGSDISLLRESGIEVRFDVSPEHMHHKFAIFDRRLLVTGSYNWTRSAARFNNENIVITGQGPLVSAFRGEFERLWSAFPRPLEDAAPAGA